MNWRMRMSSCSSTAYSRPAYHFESQPSMTPSRNPLGCTFCPIGSLVLLLLVDDDRDVARALDDARRAAMRAWEKPLLRLGAIDPGSLHVERVDVDVVRRLGVGDRRLERLGDDLRRAARVELEDAVRLLHPLAADEIDDQARLLRRDADVSSARSG